MPDARRRIPATDAALADPRLSAAIASHGRDAVKAAVRQAQGRARAGTIAPEAVIEHAAQRVAPLTAMTPVLNATGIVVHTNLGRAPLSPAARQALTLAAGTVDLEMSLETGARSGRAVSVEQAIRTSLEADLHGADLGVLVVNNGAAALVLATTALAARVPLGDPEVVISRGEFVEIGAGFRLSDLIASTGTTLREVGTTNRTHLADYLGAVGPRTACVLRVHPSNFRVQGFTSNVAVAELSARLRAAGTPLVVDVGSGLLQPDPGLPAEPDVSTMLREGADLVLCSGDKLLGGPQAGILVGRADLIQQLRRFPLARALRADKLALAALEATVRGGHPPVTEYRRRTRESLRPRTEKIAAAVGGQVVEVEGHVGGGGAPGVPLPGLAVALASGASADEFAAALRTGAQRGHVAVLPRVNHHQCLIDLRCIDEQDDEDLLAAIDAALRWAGDRHPQTPGGGGG